MTARIQALAEDDASDIRAWAEAIKGDPAALSVILRQARLADPPYDGRMNAIERAVGQLGKEQVVALVGDPKALHRTQLFERSGFVLEDFWHHNLAVAYAASLLAFPLQLDQQTPEQQQRLASFKIPELELEELRRIDLPGRLGLDPTRDEPYLAGLVHDLGKVAMVQAYPQWYAQIEAALKERGWQTGMTRLEASLADGFDHAAAGGALAEAWGFDDELCRVIRSHHRPDPDDALSWLVGFADVIGQRVCPFPLASHYPFDPAWSVQGLDRIKDLLPQGFGEQAWLSAEEFCFVGRLWAPVVRQLVDQRIPD